MPNQKKLHVFKQKESGKVGWLGCERKREERSESEDFVRTVNGHTVFFVERPRY